MDLGDWRGHRVLAKRGSVYLPGVLKSVGAGGGHVEVQFDQEPIQSVRFHNPATEVIGDYTPPSSLIRDGDRVCVKIDPDQNVFAESYVCQINVPATDAGVEVHALTQYRVRIVGQDLNNEKVVRRPHLRLLKPPWWEELEALYVRPSHAAPQAYMTTPVGSASLNTSGSAGISTALPAPVATPSTSAAGHLVLPCTSPLVPGPSIGQTAVAIAGLAHTRSSSGSDEVRRRFDVEYDSEDELHQAGMGFADGGKFVGE